MLLVVTALLVGLLAVWWLLGVEWVTAGSAVLKSYKTKPCARGLLMNGEARWRLKYGALA